MTNKLEHIYQNESFGENWFSAHKLYSDVANLFPSGSVFVEVGSWKGKSAAYMAVELANVNKDIKFFCVDTWQGSAEHADSHRQELPQLYDIFLNNMKPLEKYYTPMKISSLEAAGKFADASLDFVFIDASHEYQDVLNDIAAWWPKVKPGGILAGDDFSSSWPGVVQAVKESFESFEILDCCWVVNKPALTTPKIAVYAISKNEEQNIDQFIENVKHFDDVYVLDTGSTDDTVNKLKAHGIKVTTKIYDNFNFAQARNDCLNLVPTDVDWCISLDFNEKIELNVTALNVLKHSRLTSGILTKCFLFNFDENQYIEVESKIKLHRRHGFVWVRSIHEELMPNNSVGSIRPADALKFYKYSQSSPAKLELYKKLCLAEYNLNKHDPYYIRFLLDYSFEEKDWPNVYKYGIEYLNLTESQRNWFRPRTFILLSKYFDHCQDSAQAKDFAFHALSESLKYRDLYPFWVRDSYKNLQELGIEIYERRR